MPQGKGKASPPRRRSSDGHPYDGRPRLAAPTPSTASAPSSFFDASIPLNLPPRRSMKMLKDGSDFVWPDAAHSLFVRGLQAWKFLNLGSKRTRAPRGEGKTDFLVRYLENHGVERTKKQVASHLQVLRTEWRNSDNLLLLSLVDDTVSHTRSLSEPSLPFPPPPQPSSTRSSPSTSLSVFNSAPDPGDNRAISTPSLPYPVSTVSPPHSSSLFHPAHNIYDSRSHLYAETTADSNLFRNQPSSNAGSWQLDDTVWHTPVDRLPIASQHHQSESYARTSLHYPVASYDPPTSYNDYDRTPRPIVSHSPLESRSFNTEYYSVSGLPGRDDSSPLDRTTSSSLSSLPQEAGPQSTRGPLVSTSPYQPYNPSPYHPVAQPDAYGHASTSYGTEPYLPHFGSAHGTNPTPHAHTAASGSGSTIAGSESFDVVEPDFLPPSTQQPRWIRPPAAFSRQPDTPERHDRSPEL